MHASCHSSHVIFYNCPVLSMAALSFAAMPCIFFLLTAQTALTFGTEYLGKLGKRFHQPVG